MGDKYAPNDKVFAKLKGFAPWPARVMERVPGRDEKYRIFFYGSHDESVVKLDQLYKYSEDTKAKYGKPSKKAKFQDAMTEIEAEILAEGGGESAENQPLGEVEEPMEEKPKIGEGESEGELMIDEGAPALPPVLKKEIETPEPAGKAKRPRTLSKRESTSTPQQSTPTPATQASMAVTPGTPDANQPPGSEIVSRSGRKIKPKRFADEEITPVGKGKTEPDSQPMTKRSKRGSISAKSAPPVKVDEAPHLEAEGRDNNEAAPRSRTSSRSKAETMDSKGPPTLKAVSKRASSANNKQIPVLEPSQPTPSTRKSERLTRSSSTDESKDSILTDDPTPELEPQEMPMDIDERELDKENSNEPSLVYEEDEGAEDMSASGLDDSHSETATQVLTKEKKYRIATNEGVQIELSYDSENPNSKSEDDNKAWQAIAGTNLKKVIEYLKDDLESQDLINSAADSVPSANASQAKSREKLAMQLKLLRLEGEVIEIIGEIVGCLGEHSVDWVRALDLLDRLGEHQLNRLLLVKHPEIVENIQKLKNYVGNVDAWGYDEEQKTEFATYAAEIRKRAIFIYEHFQEVFGVSSAGEFATVFEEEERRFREKVEHLPLKTILGLTEDHGELVELALDVNGHENGEEYEDENESIME